MKITKLAPGINPDVVRLGLNVFFQRGAADAGLSGFLSAHDDRNVTLVGIPPGGGTQRTEKVNADDLKAENYEALRFSDELTDISTSGWTVDDAVEIFDPDVCVPEFFIMYRTSAAAPYINGIIASWAEKKLTIRTGASAPSISIADALKAGFDVIVSPTIEGGVIQSGATFERLEG